MASYSWIVLGIVLVFAMIVASAPLQVERELREEGSGSPLNKLFRVARAILQSPFCTFKKTQRFCA